MIKNVYIKKAVALAAMVTVILTVIPASKASAGVISGQTYKLINVNSGKALDVDACGKSNYNNVAIYADNGSVAQKWNIIANSDGTYKLINPNSNKALDVYAAATADYTNVDIYDDNGTRAQKWNIVANSDGTYKLINVNSGKALDVYAAGTTNSTNVDIYADNGTAAQKWKLVQLSGSTTTPTVGKPAEVPADMWQYAYNVDTKFGKNGDFALLLCAVMKKESNFGASLSGSPSSGDGVMQVEPNTRNAYASKFSSTFGRTYNHSSLQDQISMGGLIINEMTTQFGGVYNGLLHYNGGPNWYPGVTDSYGRVIEADKYADAVYGTYKGYGGKQ